MHGLPLGWTRQLSRISRCCRACIKSHHLPVNHHTKSTSLGVQELNQSSFVFTMILSTLTSHVSQIKIRQFTKIWVKPSSPTSSITTCPASLFVCTIVRTPSRRLSLFLWHPTEAGEKQPISACLCWLCIRAAKCRWGESSSSSKCVCKNADVNQTHYQYFYMTAHKKWWLIISLSQDGKNFAGLGNPKLTFVIDSSGDLMSPCLSYFCFFPFLFLNVFKK